MNPDLTELLDAWKYEPGKINVRLIESASGLSYVQVRLDLGFSRCTGRPPGWAAPPRLRELPEMVESWIEEASRADQQSEFESEFESEEHRRGPLQPPRNNHAGSGDLPFRLSRSSAILRDEAIQYHHRYLAALALDYERVVRDAEPACAGFAGAVRRARGRPGVGLAHEVTRDDDACPRLASMAIRDNEPKAAIFAIEEGIEARKHSRRSVMRSCSSVRARCRCYRA